MGLEPAALLDPSAEARLRPLYNALLDRAEAHLAAGWDYTNQLPVSCPRLRLACAWPVLIGVRTLALLRTRNPLDPARRVKVSRPAVRALLLRSVLLYPAPPLWRHLWVEAGGMR
jgi:farnesyl-diphosphate farnesyltransferase